MQKSIKKCEDTFCKEYHKKVLKLSKEILKAMVLQFKKKNNSNEEIQNKINKAVKNIEDKFKTKEFIKKSKESCRTGYCNPECKGTVFQNGEFPKEIEQKLSKIKHGEITLEYLKKYRDGLFKNKKTIIKDSFYYGLKKKNIKNLKKDGALSGCTIMAIK